MKTYGFEITQDQIAAAESVMFSGHAFSAMDVTFALEKAGVKYGAPAYRTADKLLQKHRKAGAIAFAGGMWRACK